MHALPIHPTTGLRAIFVSERTGRIYWPILGGEESADAAAQAAARAEADAQAASEAAAAAENAERGYPLKTSPSDMTTDQQVAYYKAMARKHEDRAKGMDSDELKQLRARAKRADELERQNMDVQERAVAEARDTARQEAETAATAKYAPRLAETAFRVAIGTRKSQEDVDEFIADLNLPRFLTDEGQVDTAKVLARVEQFAPVTGAQQKLATRGPVVIRHGSGNGTSGTASASGSVSAGRDLWAETHPKKAS
jgi:hypothetical protein